MRQGRLRLAALGREGEPRHLGRHLRLESEAVALEANSLDDLAAEDFVADLHVGQVQVGQHVREEREPLVRQRMPEIEDPVLLADEPRAEDDVGLILDDRLDELGILRRVVFEVGVLDDDDLAGGVAEPGAERGALSLVAS